MATSLYRAKVMAYFVFVFFGSVTYAQPENANWVIDGDIWIDFNSGTPVVKEEPLEFSTIEAAASISDSLGNLLFYTNGVEVYNRLGEVISEMEIPIDDTGWIKSYTQGVLVLPEISMPNLYRIIGIGKYAIVDMSLNGGLGGMATFPSWQAFDSDFPLDNPGFAEKNQAVRHANGRDWWILQLRIFPDYVHDTHDSVIVSYLYDENGIHKVQENRVNLYHSGSASKHGEMIFDSNGDKIALALIGSLVVYEFDRCTGLVGEIIVHLDSLRPIYGCSFSANGRFLYFNTSSGFIFGDNVLYQLDLEKDQFGINKLTEIYRRDESSNFANGQLELGPDGKIYMAIACKYYGCELYTPFNTNLSVINFPDLPGFACNFDTLSISLQGRRTMYALPNTVNYALGPLEGSECDTLGGGSTSVPETASIPQWQVAPTVSTGWYSFNGPEQAQLLAYDVWGRTVWQGSAIGQRIDLSDLPSGLYLLQAQWEQKQETFRILKQ